MRNKLVIALLVLVGLAVVAPTFVNLFPVRYSVRDDPAGVAVLWRGDEAIIFVEMHRTAFRVSALADRLGTWAPDGLRQSLHSFWPVPASNLGFRFSAGQLERFELKNGGNFSSFVVAEGQPAVVWVSPRRQEWRGYRWNGTAFAELSELDADRLRDAAGIPDRARIEMEENSDSYSELQAERERLTGAGWNVDRMEMGLRGGTLKFSMGSGEAELKYQAEIRGYETTSGIFEVRRPISLSLRAGGQEQMLWDSTGAQRQLKREEYLALFPPEDREWADRTPNVFAPFFLLGWIMPLLFHVLPWLPFILPVIWAMGYRSRTLRTMPDTFDFQPAVPSDFEQLDQAGLESFTAALEALGFQQVRDISVVPDVGKYEPDFSRLMVHSEHHCFAQIVQFFPGKPAAAGKRPQPMAVVLHSMLEDDWTLSTSNQPTPAMTYRMRVPKALWFWRAGAAPAALLEAHLARRREICDALGLGVAANLNFALYQSYVLARYAGRRAALRKQGALFGPREALVFAMRPPQEWMGDYAKRSG